MFNYIFEIEWCSYFRLKLIKEKVVGNDEEAEQAKSQTSWITACTIHCQSSDFPPV